MEIWLYSNPYLNESGISKKVKFKLNTRCNNVNRSKWFWKDNNNKNTNRNMFTLQAIPLSM